MPLVLEITGTNLKAGVADSTRPEVLPVKYHHYKHLHRFPPNYHLNGHSITQEQKNEIVKNLSPKFQQEVKEYEKYLGHFLPLMNEAFPVHFIRKLVHQILFQYSLIDDSMFVVDHNYSENFKSVIRDTLKGLRVQEIFFLPCSVLASIGANERDVLVIYFTMECVKMYVVSDLREITIREDSRVNLLNKGDHHDIIQELIDEVIEKSPIDLRRKLRERIVVLSDDSNEYIQFDLTPEKQQFQSRQSVGCWIACALYAQTMD
ncbi:hypothetical protein CORT_0H00130 [Candida orthopsilosis Co 90-125]|uniref:Uncharacterized protein n=1 Tax=Candida orthopsilosis (strain 90-125) TaxID=1136231 RepID=H8XBE3_CANO9|nr:hypothetical protein CORT_0H00130 [Candida orthopsilosis Co 90-125]CCG25131.1 hypothetical protein CORT_0H00130 [Candida orthopsilosis Co 90-125]